VWPNQGTYQDILCLIREYLRIVCIPSREKFRIFYAPKREHVPTRKDFRRVFIPTREHFRIVCVPNQVLNHKPSEYKAETLVTC
jgi:hypothetical protein